MKFCFIYLFFFEDIKYIIILNKIFLYLIIEIINNILFIIDKKCY